jgi:hypothetical protein
MTVTTLSYAAQTNNRPPARQRGDAAQTGRAEDTPISPRVVYPALIVVSLLLWGAMAELVISVVPLFS